MQSNTEQGKNETFLLLLAKLNGESARFFNELPSTPWINELLILKMEISAQERKPEIR